MKTKLFTTLAVALTLAVAPVQTTLAAPAAPVAQPAPLTLAIAGMPTLAEDSNSIIPLQPTLTFDAATATYTLTMYDGQIVNLPYAKTITEFSAMAIEEVDGLSVGDNYDGTLYVDYSYQLEPDQTLVFPLHLQLTDMRAGSATCYQTYGNVINFNVVITNPSDVANAAIAESLKAEEAEFVRLLNEHRASKGLAPVTVTADAQKFAEVRARETAELGALKHVRPGGKDIPGYENLSCAPTANASFTSQKNSTRGHYETLMMEDIVEFGVAFHRAKNGKTYIAVEVNPASCAGYGYNQAEF